MKSVFGILAFFLCIQLSSAQSWQVVEETEEVEVKYKWKENDANVTELRVKLKNKAKSDLNVDVEVAFYDNGILEQSSLISTCLEKGLFKNWFRNWHVIQAEDGGSLKGFELKVSELNSTKVEECEQTDADA
jgi:hypothetical protein